MQTEPAETTACFFSPFVSSFMRPEPGWFDYNGHLNMAYYHVLFDRAVDEAFALCGLGPDYARLRGMSFFTVENRVSYRREIRAGEPVRVTVRLISFDDKRLHVFMELRHATEAWLAATSENLSLHVNLLARKAAPFPADIARNLDDMRAAHAGLPLPEGLGAGIAMPERQRMN
jgi:acyl-CoA thioester hydrolase